MTDPRHYSTPASPEELRLSLLLAETAERGRASHDPDERRRLAETYRELQKEREKAHATRILEGEEAKWALEIAWPE